MLLNHYISNIKAHCLDIGFQNPEDKQNFLLSLGSNMELKSAFLSNNRRKYANWGMEHYD